MNLWAKYSRPRQHFFAVLLFILNLNTYMPYVPAHKMSLVEYEADLESLITNRDEALSELENAGDDEKSVDAAVEKIKAYSTLIAHRKAAIAALPQPIVSAPHLPRGSLNLGEWMYVFDPVGGNRWMKTVLNAHDNHGKHDNPLQQLDEKMKRLTRGEGVRGTSEERSPCVNNKVVVLVNGKFYSMGGADDTAPRGEIAPEDSYVSIFDEPGKHWKFITRYPHNDPTNIVAAAIGNIIYTHCGYLDRRGKYHEVDSEIHTLDTSSNPPIWRTIPYQEKNPVYISHMFRSGNCIVTASNEKEALGVICDGMWTPMDIPFPIRIEKIEWSDYVPAVASQS